MLIGYRVKCAQCELTWPDMVQGLKVDLLGQGI